MMCRLSHKLKFEFGIWQWDVFICEMPSGIVAWGEGAAEERLGGLSDKINKEISK